MDNFWVKVVIIIVAVVAVVAGINYFKGPKPQQPAPQEKTIGDTWREDDKRLRTEPNVTPASTQPQQLEQPTIKFKELTEEQQAGAEQLFEMAIASRKMARLPGVGYREMVDYCRQLIERYPGSEFDYKARRMLGEVPQNEWERYHITQEEIDGPTK
ncbi:MAG: hypothetical protein JW749_10885 [Sedimentisphaerales bacterium]|nr:hypothetical protein [Sedimentisphaerales bacterium]